MNGASGSGVTFAAAAAFSGVLFAVAALAVGIAVLYWGCWIAKQRGYSVWLGLALAFFLGLIGIIILYVLPTRRPAAPLPRIDGYDQYPVPPGSAPGRPPTSPGWSTAGPPPPWVPRAGQELVPPAPETSLVPEAPPAPPPAAPSAPATAEVPPSPPAPPSGD